MSGVQLLPGGVDRKLVMLGDGPEQMGKVAVAFTRLGPGYNSALPQGQVWIGHDERRVQLPFAAQTGALGASAVGTVEGEATRLDLWKAETTHGAGVLFRVHDLLAVDHAHQRHAIAQLERSFHRVAQAAAIRVPPFPLVIGVMTDDETIYDGLNRVHLVTVQGDLCINVIDLAVDAQAHIACLAQVLDHALVFALAVADERSHNHDAAAVIQAQDAVRNLRHGLSADLSPTDGAVGNAHPSIEQAQVIIDLGDRAHRRARATARALLVDADGRRKTIDVIHIGLVHLAQKLSGVCRERFDIAALPLGIDSIKGQRGFARTRQARDDHQLVAGDVDVNIL